MLSNFAHAFPPVPEPVEVSRAHSDGAIGCELILDKEIASLRDPLIVARNVGNQIKNKADRFSNTKNNLKINPFQDPKITSIELSKPRQHTKGLLPAIIFQAEQKPEPLE